MNFQTAVALFFICWSVPLFAGPLVVVEGGVSPDKRFAVAVVPQKKGEDIDEGDTTVYLIDNQTKKPIGPLEEVDSGGGNWGKTTGNVSARWSADGRFLAINMRVGRLMHDFVLYEITGRRARPQTLPSPKTHPKGRIYEELTSTANPGQTVTGWQSPTQLTVEEYGLRPRDMAKGIGGSELGLDGFDDGRLEQIFVFQKSRWVLKDIRVPKSKQN